MYFSLASTEEIIAEVIGMMKLRLFTANKTLETPPEPCIHLRIKQCVLIFQPLEEIFEVFLLLASYV